MAALYPQSGHGGKSRKRKPFLPAVRQSFWLLIIWALSALVFKPTVSIPVESNSSGYQSRRPLPQMPAGVVLAEGRLKFSNPDTWQLLLLTDERLGCNRFTVLMIIAGSLLIIFIVPANRGKNFFQKDSAVLIWSLGALVMLHTISMAVAEYYSSHLVESLTHRGYAFHIKFPLLMYAEGYIATVILAIGTWHRQGVRLYNEQSLTI